MKAIIFDFHATLAYKEQSVTIEDIMEVLHEAGVDIGPQEWEAAYRYVFFVDFPRERFRSWNEYQARVLELLGIMASDELVQELCRIHNEKNRWRLFPEVPEVLESLSRDFNLGIATTIPSFQVLPILGELESHFGFIGTGDTVGKAKGNRSFYLTIAEELCAEPDGSLFVGDDPLLDVEIPHSLGFHTAHLMRKGGSRCEAADFQITSLRELGSIVRHFGV
ncbi:MAG: HAD family hydrolase [Thermoplasmata archaeon]